jgi:GGDEF domain-containing protein
LLIPPDVTAVPGDPAIARPAAIRALSEAMPAAAGDNMLRQVATLLSSSVRPGDTVCRYRDVQFALILPEASLAITAQRAREIFAGTQRIRLRGPRDLAP